MIAAFPHMGNMYVTLKALLAGLGAEVRLPPPVTKRTMELGVRHAPETVCLPFKIMLGNFIEALNQGADTLITCGGVGPCRLGHYAQLQRGILEDLGYSFEMIVIEPDLFTVLSSLRRMPAGTDPRKLYKAFRLAGAKMAGIDQVEEKLRLVRPRVRRTGETEAIWDRFLINIDKAADIAAVTGAIKEGLNQLDALPVNENFQPLRIAITGEIYVMLESFVNQQLDQRLGEMGVEVHKTMTLTEYVRTHLMHSSEYRKAYQHVVGLAKPYLGHYVGGHGIKTIGCTVEAGQTGLDGVIQVFPFTCMPEVIAKNILPSVSENLGIPVLSLVFDEQSGEAGTLTRLEAYIDLLRYRSLKRLL